MVKDKKKLKSDSAGSVVTEVTSDKQSPANGGRIIIPFIEGSVSKSPILDIGIIEQELAPAVLKHRKEDPFKDNPVLLELIVDHYEGDTADGQFHGDGEIYFKGGYEYVGNLNEGEMNGNGRYLWPDGVTYEGEFRDNQITGTGEYRWPDGCCYEGQVLRGLRHGQGRFYSFATEVAYDGSWVHGRRSGPGILYYSEGSVYDGDWLDNMKHGYGVRRYISGNLYEGEWKHNNRHGNGTMRWNDRNEIYTGQWENGIQNGHGQHTWYLRRVHGTQYALRNHYIGQWRNGVREGFGTFYYANGAKYEGEWLGNRKHGKGTFTFKNGRIYEGIFLEDHIVEFPDYNVEGDVTPDISQIRTMTPVPNKEFGEEQDNSNPIATEVKDLINSVVGEVEASNEIVQVQNAILRYLTSLKKIYNLYSSLGYDTNIDNTFVMTRLQYWRLLKDCKIHGLRTLAELDCCLATAPSHDPEDRLLFREFINNLVVISYHLYGEEEPKSVANCLVSTITKHILKYAGTVGGHFMCEPRRAVIAIGYIDSSWDIYRNCCQSMNRRNRKKDEMALNMRDFLLLLNELKLVDHKLTAKQIIEVLASDDPKIHDDTFCNLEGDMVFLEFFEALLGCAEVYVTEEMIQNSSTPTPKSAEIQSRAQTSVSGFSHSHVTDVEDSNDPEGADDGHSGIPSSRDGNASAIVAEKQDNAKPVEDKTEETVLPKCSVLVSEVAEEEPAAPTTDFQDNLDEDTRRFNFWTHQLHIFFTNVLYRSVKHAFDVKAEIAAHKVRLKEIEKERLMEECAKRRMEYLMRASCREDAEPGDKDDSNDVNNDDEHKCAPVPS